MLGIRRRVGHRLPDTLEVPEAIHLHQDRREPGRARQPAVGRRDLGDPVLEGHVGRHQFGGGDDDGELGPLLPGEHLLVQLLNRRPSLDLAADLIDVIPVRGPERGHGLGVAAVERRDELLGPLSLPQSLGALGRLGGHLPRPKDQAEGQGGDQAKPSSLPLAISSS